MEQDMMDAAKEVQEEALWETPAKLVMLCEGPDTYYAEPREGHLDKHDMVFVSTAGFRYAVESVERWNGTRYLVWGTEGCIGEVRL